MIDTNKKNSRLYVVTCGNRVVKYNIVCQYKNYFCTTIDNGSSDYEWTWFKNNDNIYATRELAHEELQRIKRTERYGNSS